MIPVDDKYLMAILNSRTVLFFYAHIASTIRGGYLRFKRLYLEQIPIPPATPAQKAPITALVNQILAAKAADRTTDTNELEAEVGQLVYELYGLSAEEIGVIVPSAIHSLPLT